MHPVIRDFGWRIARRWYALVAGALTGYTVAVLLDQAHHTDAKPWVPPLWGWALIGGVALLFASAWAYYDLWKQTHASLDFTPPSPEKVERLLKKRRDAGIKLHEAVGRTDSRFKHQYQYVEAARWHRKNIELLDRCGQHWREGYDPFGPSDHFMGTAIGPVPTHPRAVALWLVRQVNALCDLLKEPPSLQLPPGDTRPHSNGVADGQVELAWTLPPGQLYTNSGYNIVCEVRPQGADSYGEPRWWRPWYSPLPDRLVETWPSGFAAVPADATPEPGLYDVRWHIDDPSNSLRFPVEFDAFRKQS